MLATTWLHRSDAEYFFEIAASFGQDEEVAALAMTVTRDARLSPHLQAGAVASARSAAIPAVLQHLVSDTAIKPWLRVLAVRGLGQERPEVLPQLAFDQSLPLWPRLGAVDRIGRAGMDNDLWTVATATGLDPRVRRFAVWWAGRLDDDTRLANLANTETESELTTAVEDARSMVSMRTFSNPDV